MMSLSVATHLFSYWKISLMEIYQRIPLSSDSITTFKGIVMYVDLGKREKKLFKIEKMATI